jgi:hypothetical protein
MGLHTALRYSESKLINKCLAWSIVIFVEYNRFWIKNVSSGIYNKCR